MSINAQLKQAFAHFDNPYTGTFSPEQMLEIQKAYGFQPQQRQSSPSHLSAEQRQNNIEAFNTNLQAQAAEMGKQFVENTQHKPIEEQYSAYQNALTAVKNQYATLPEEQQNLALSAFSNVADVMKRADEQAGFLERTGDAASYLLTTPLTLAEQVAGLFSPEGDVRQFFKESNDEVKSWRSDEAKLRSHLAAQEMAKAKANGETGFTQFFANAVENPLETIGGFVESAAPTVAAAVAGAAAAPFTGGTSLYLPFVVGGLQSAGATRNEIYDHIKAMPTAELAQNPQYQALLSQGLTAEQAREELASSIVEHGGEVLAAGATGAAMSGLGGLGRIGQVGKGVLNSTKGKLVSELVTEPTEEVLQQLAVNKAIHDVDTNRSYTEGLGEAAAGGLLFGAAGGAIAAADNARRQPSQQPTGQPSVADELAPSPQMAETPTVQAVDGNAIERVLTPYQDTDRFESLYQELKSDIEDGLIAERAKKNDEYGRLAQAYLAQVETNPQQAETIPAASSEQAVSSAENVAENSLQQTANLEQNANRNVIVGGADTAVDIQQTTINSNEQGGMRMSNLEQGNTAQDSIFGEEPFDKVGTLEQPKDTELDERYSRSPIKSVEANVKRGREAMNTAIAERRTVHRAMFNHELDGWVDFEWGDVGRMLPNGKTKGAMGVSHIIDKRMKVDGMNEQEVTRFLVEDVTETIAKGQVARESTFGKTRSVEIVHNGNEVRVTKKEGNNAWVVTGFKQYQPMNQSRGATTSDLRNNSPIRSRTELGAVGADNVQQPQTNSQVEQDKSTLSRILGEELASQMEVIDSRSLSQTQRERLQDENGNLPEGFFVISQNKIYLLSDQIHATSVMSRDERLAWVGWHEAAHNGVRVKFGESYQNVLNAAAKNAVVGSIARRRLADGTDRSRLEAVEETMVELYAAAKTNNWTEIESRYGVKIHDSWKQGKNNLGDFLTKITNTLRRIINGVIGRDVNQQMTTEDVFKVLKGIDEGVQAVNVEQSFAETGTRYSLNENRDSEFAKAVDAVANGQTVQGYVNVGTTPDVLKNLGLPDVNVTIHGSTFKKVMGGKHNLTPETLKQLPKQINDPVAVMRSAPQASQQGYVILTELVESNPVTSKNEPVVSALHLKQDANGLEIINIASVYGKNLRGLQNMLNHDLMYWNNEKGTNLINTFGLQLPAYALKNQSLSNDTKTESDLSQYQNGDIRFSRTDYNQAKADGRTELTFEQYKQVRTPEFKRWFGDWENDPENASKVVNPKTGEPLVVYRSDSTEFYKFDKRKAKQGFFFSSNKGIVSLYGNNAKSFFLNIRQPLVTEKAMPNEKNAQDVKNTQFDGVLNKNVYGKSDEYIAISANQIKSATDNNGEFSLGNDDIRFSRSGNRDVLANATPKRNANSFEQAKSAAKDFLNKMLHNDETGIEATVSRANLDKMLSGKAHAKSTSLHDHLMAVANVDQLFENAVHGWTEKHKNDSPDVLGVHKMFAPLNLDGNVKLVKLTVKELKPEQGNRVYSVETIEVSNEKAPVPEMTELGFDANSHRLHGGSGSNANVESLIQKIKDFNSQSDIRFSRPKSESLEKLRNAETIRISGTDIEPSSDIRQYRRNALEFGKTLRGNYVNRDTGRMISLGRAGVTEVLHHDVSNPEHLQSVAAIPQIIEQATYIDTLPNEDKAKNPDIQSYEYYVAGLNIGGTDYTVKAAVATSTTGDRYYDHKLTEIEKGDLLEMTSRLSSAEISNLSPEVEDKRLAQILQVENAISDEDLRFSRPKTILETLSAGKVSYEPDNFVGKIRQDGFESWWSSFKKNLDYAATDETRPVADWVNGLDLTRAEQVDMLSELDRAEGIRHALNSNVMQKFLRPLMENISKLAKKHSKDAEWTKVAVEHWYSALITVALQKIFAGCKDERVTDRLYAFFW